MRENEEGGEREQFSKQPLSLPSDLNRSTSEVIDGGNVSRVRKAALTHACLVIIFAAFITMVHPYKIPRDALSLTPRLYFFWGGGRFYVAIRGASQLKHRPLCRAAWFLPVIECVLFHADAMFYILLTRGSVTSSITGVRPWASHSPNAQRLLPHLHAPPLRA